MNIWVAEKSSDLLKLLEDGRVWAVNSLIPQLSGRDAPAADSTSEGSMWPLLSKKDGGGCPNPLSQVAGRYGEVCVCGRVEGGGGVRATHAPKNSRGRLDGVGEARKKGVEPHGQGPGL